MELANWAIIDTEFNDGVCDRFATEDEAIAALPKYPPYCAVAFVPDPCGSYGI